MARLKPGDAAPQFQLPDQQDQTVSLADFRGQKLLIYFYPKADTPGCTRQACSIHDAREALRDLGLVDASHAAGFALDQIYFNAGTWRRTFRSAALRPLGTGVHRQQRLQLPGLLPGRRAQGADLRGLDRHPRPRAGRAGDPSTPGGRRWPPTSPCSRRTSIRWRATPA